MLQKKNQIITLFIFLIVGGVTLANPPINNDIWKNQKQIILLDFEDSDAMKIIESVECNSEITKDKGVTNGSKALKIVLKKDEPNTSIDIRPKKAWSTKGLDDFCFVMDVTSLSDVSTNLNLELYSAKGGHFRRLVCIPANTSKTYYFELKGKDVFVENGLRNNPPPWKTESVMMLNTNYKGYVDANEISRLRFYASSLYEDKTLVIDNIRLIESPERDADYLTAFVDKYGQNHKADFPLKIKSDKELEILADKELKALAVSEPMADRSKFGGWKNGPKLEATGYFRTEKVGDKWSLVDPEGYLYFSSGLANVRMANSTTFTGMDYTDEAFKLRDPDDVTPEDSKDILTLNDKLTSTAFKAYPERAKMFVELPAYDDPLANHYSYRREAHVGTIKHGETFSFYRANLERRYGEQFEGSYLMKWHDVTIDRMQDWGFTSFGNWAGEEFYGSKRMPYFANTWVIGDFKTIGKGIWHNMADPFDPEFVRRAKYAISVVANQVKNNPWCVGIFVDNEKSWGNENSFRERYILALDALSMAESELPTKAVYMKFLMKKYPSAKALSKAWGVKVSSWDALAKGISFHTQNKYNDAFANDLGDMVEIYASEYFKIVHDALKEQLPNHLYLGCRFTPWGMTAEVRKSAAKYVDVFSYNYYREALGKKYWSFLSEIDKPAMIGEFHFGSTSDTGIPHAGLLQAADQNDRARLYKQYMNEAIDNPYFVGAHWFQYFDSSITGRAHDGENCNIGFVTITDIPYPQMVKAAKEMHENLYPRRFGDLKKN